MIIDWHAHIYTPEEAADDRRTYDGQSGPSWGERGCPMVLENFLEAHHQAGIDLSVVTNAAHYLRAKAASEELPAVQRWSDYAAQLPIRVSCIDAASLRFPSTSARLLSATTECKHGFFDLCHCIIADLIEFEMGKVRNFV